MKSPLANKRPALASFNGIQALPSEIGFRVKFSTECKFLSFSQRRFLGFRNRAEYDRKRLLVASNEHFMIMGYDHDEIPFEILRGSVPEGERIVFVSFLEEHNPNFVILISNTTETDDNIHMFRIYKIKKNPEFQGDPVAYKQEDKNAMKESVKRDIRNGVGK